VTPNYSDEDDSVDSDDDDGKPAPGPQRGVAPKKTGFLDKMAGMAVKQMVKHSTPDLWNEEDWAKAEALGMDPKEKGKKQSPADLAKVQKVKAQIARNKSALNNKKRKESDEDTESDDDIELHKMESRGLTGIMEAQPAKNQKTSRRKKESSDEDDEADVQVKGKSRLCAPSSIWGTGRLTGLCNGMTKGHESDDDMDSEKHSDTSGARDSESDSDSEKVAAKKATVRENKSVLDQRRKLHSRRTTSHEGRASSALPGWGETLSAMNWSLAHQKLKAEASSVNASLQLKAAEGIDKLVKDTQNLQKKADDLTKNLTGRQRDATNPLYKGYDEDSD